MTSDNQDLPEVTDSANGRCIERLVMPLLRTQYRRLRLKATKIRKYSKAERDLDAANDLDLKASGVMLAMDEIKRHNEKS